MAKAAIEAANLAVGYEKRTVLEGLSFSIEKGELVGIVGPNGAGKSTLLKTLRGLLPRQHGTVAVLGEEIDTLPPKAFSRRVAYLQQSLAIPFSYTVEELVLTGRYPYLSWWQRESARDREIASVCMAYTGVSDLKERSVSALSGGQRQRVLLARTLAQKTPILLLDEPATGLDLIYQEELFRFCRELCRAGKTVVMVAHELSLAARFCSRLLLVGQRGYGSSGIVADGRPEEVLTAERLTAVYGAPVEVAVNPATGHAEIYTTGQENAERQLLLERILEE